MSFEEEGQAVLREIGMHQAEPEGETADPQPRREPEEGPRPRRRRKFLILGTVATSILALSVLFITALGGGGPPEKPDAEERMSFTEWVGEEARQEEAREAIRKQATMWRVKGREPEKSGLAKFLDNLMTNIRGFFN